MGLLDKIFKDKKESSDIQNAESIIENENTNPWKIDEADLENKRKQIEREQQLKFVFRNLSCIDLYIDDDTIKNGISMQAFQGFELTNLDMEVLKKLNKSYMNKNISQEELDYLNNDPEKIVDVINNIENNAKEQAKQYGYKETEAHKFIETNGKIKEYMNIEKNKEQEEQLKEQDEEYDDR